MPYETMVRLKIATDDRWIEKKLANLQPKRREMTEKGKRSIAILGGGNLGRALAMGWVESSFCEAGQITITRRNPDKLTFFADAGFRVGSDNVEAARDADVIILAVHANPDGMELVSNWYMRTQNPQERSSSGIPRLYQKYIGHDNNRDFYMSTQPETTNMNRVLYHEWFPQIMYNHHQTGPAGTVMFAPPFRDPHNHNFDRLIVTGIDLVGAAMHNRFVAENKPGVVMRRGAGYSTWWNGGLRTTVYFHNMIGLLTETIGNPTPMRIPLVPNRQEPTADIPMPIEPQEWHFRQSVDYSVTANYAVLDVASRYRETFLFNIWRMGMNSVERGRKDTWTVTDHDVARLRTLVAAADSANRAGQGGGAQQAGNAAEAQAALFARGLRDPSERDPRAYVLLRPREIRPLLLSIMSAARGSGENEETLKALQDAADGIEGKAGDYLTFGFDPWAPT